MSLLGNIFRAAAPIVGGFLGGPVGATIGTVLSASASKPQPSFAPQPISLPGIGQAMGSLPAIGGAVVAGGRLALAGARVAISSAKYYCSRYPGWCIAAGGLGAVQGMVEKGQLPPHRRRRRRGISAREFGAFRKVHRVLSGFCAPRMRVRRARARA